MTREMPPAHRQSTMPEKENTADTTDQHTNHHHSTKTTKDSTDHTITHHIETSYTTFFSRIATVEEVENQVAGDKHCTYTVLRKSSLYMNSTSSKMSHLLNTRSSQKLPDSQETTKSSTLICQSTLSTTDNKHWTLIKGPTSKFYDVVWYKYIKQLYKRGTKQHNTVYWYDTLEQSCSDPLGGGGGPPLLRLVLQVTLA